MSVLILSWIEGWTASIIAWIPETIGALTPSVAAMSFVRDIRSSRISFALVLFGALTAFFASSKIVGPDKNCDCYYLPECINGRSCIEEISAEKILTEIKTILPLWKL